jgi:hypothetical protein
MKWRERYSSTEEPDEMGRWARLCFNDNEVMIAWVSRLQFIKVPEQVDTITFSARCYFPTKPNTDTPMKFKQFDSFEKSKKWVEEEWSEFVKSIKP